MLLRHAARIAKLITESKGEVACGGVYDIDAAYVAPTLIKTPDLESAVMKDEIFGPVLPVLPMKNVDEAIQFINDRLAIQRNRGTNIF